MLAPISFGSRSVGSGKASGLVSAEYHATSPRNDMSTSLWSTPSRTATSAALANSRLCVCPYWNVMAVSRSERDFA